MCVLGFVLSLKVEVITYVLSDVGGGGRSSFCCCPSVVSDVAGRGLASFRLVVRVKVRVRIRVRVRNWVRVWVKVRVSVRVTTLTILSLPLGPFSSHISRCFRSLKPTAIQGVSSVNNKRMTRQDKGHSFQEQKENTTQHKTTQNKGRVSGDEKKTRCLSLPNLTLHTIVFLRVSSIHTSLEPSLTSIPSLPIPSPPQEILSTQTR